MSQYRDLNKELVEQVQTMRVNIKLYCDEIINLKAELMQKYENELLLRKYCYNWALDNFQQLIQTVQPDSDILPLLKQHIRPDRETFNRRSSSSIKSRTNERIRTSGSEKSSSERRRSSIIAMECQRSNSIINNRNSVRSCSPIRPSYDNEEESEEEDQDEDAVEQDVGVLEENTANDQQTNLNDREHTTAAQEVAQSVTEANVERNKDINFVIYEESEEEDDDEQKEDETEDVDDEEDEEENLEREDDNVEDVAEQEEEQQQNDINQESQEDDEQEIESVYESVEEVTVNSSTKTRTTLTDITNTSINLSNNNNANKKPLPKKRGRPKKQAKEHENHTDTDTDLDISAVVSRRRMPQAKRNTDVRVKDCENTTIPESNHHSKTKDLTQIINKSISNALTDTDTDMEISTVSSRRRMPQKKRTTNDTSKDIENTTVQEPRRCSNVQAITQVTNKSIPLTHNLSQTCIETTLASPISVDMTLRNFKNVASSTPNSRRQSLRRPLTPPARNSPYQSPDTRNVNSTMSDNSKRRPTRQCKPKVLAEPHLRTKLRNEEEFKKKPKVKTGKNNKKTKTNQ